MQLSKSIDEQMSRSARCGDTGFDSLTSKHHEVLELLVESYETNKQIAQRLGISPSTVKQRLDYAARKLGTTGRYATKIQYERLRQACVPMVCPPEHIPISPLTPQQPPRDWGASPTLQLDDAIPFDRIAPWASVERSTGLEAFVDKLNGKSATSVIMIQAVLLMFLSVAVLAAMGTFLEFDLLRFVTP